jgi:hypothetical protein
VIASVATSIVLNSSEICLHGLETLLNLLTTVIYSPVLRRPLIVRTATGMNLLEYSTLESLALMIDLPSYMRWGFHIPR